MGQRSQHKLQRDHVRPVLAPLREEATVPPAPQGDQHRVGLGAERLCWNYPFWENGITRAVDTESWDFDFREIWVVDVPIFIHIPDAVQVAVQPAKTSTTPCMQC